MIGLAAIQWVLAVGAGMAVTSMLKVFDAADAKARIAGGVVAGAGSVFLLEGVEGALFAAMGLV